MTWIKPSFLWMMHRCGWGTKPGQERVLAIRLSRDGFEDALQQSCLSHYDPERYATEEAWHRALRTNPVRIQWDPERAVDGTPLPYRSLQVGLGPGVLSAYVNDWICSVEDITDLLAGQRVGLLALPDERPYLLPATIAMLVGATA
jgi:hypothetical protein